MTALRESPATGRWKCKFIPATDGKAFEAENLADGETVACACPDFHHHFGFFLPLAGITFPVPTLTEQNKTDLTRCAEDILLAREAHFPATIADLYDTKTMPANLREAHDRNDETLERIYIGRRFKNDTEHLEKLFELYTQMTTTPPTTKKAGRKKEVGA